MSHQGNVMTFNELKAAFPGVKVTFLTYARLVGSIPQMWKDRLSNSPFLKLSAEEKNDPFECKIGGKQLKINDLRSSHFYYSWIQNTVPTAINNWESKGYNLEWGKIFQLPYTCTTSTRLQTLQYRIIHRFLPTNRFLFSRRVIDSQSCSFCGRIDTLEHFLYDCGKVCQIWQKLFQTLNIRCQNPANACIFGLLGGTDANNTIILLVKQYLTTMKLSNPPSTPNYAGAVAFVIHHITKENKIAVKNKQVENFVRKWGDTLNLLQV